MRLARMVRLKVAEAELVEVAGRDVILVNRFDRDGSRGRNAFVSALTILGLNATFHDLADVVCQRFVRRKDTLRELLARIAFNIVVGHTDDHAQSNAAFWDGERWDEVADDVSLTSPERRELWGNQVMSPFGWYEYVN